MTNFERLIEFHKAIDGSVPERPGVPEAKILALRENLLREEYTESLKALRDVMQRQKLGDDIDMSLLIHELADLLYVTYGTLLAFGVNADEVFAEIHRANMRKLEGPKRADGKQLKPEGWQAADIAALIDKQQNRQSS
jgi:predicted HAD superfamily Cof-like phosphohydrolase